MSCRIMEFEICIFRQHFFVNTLFTELHLKASAIISNSKDVLTQ